MDQSHTASCPIFRSWHIFSNVVVRAQIEDSFVYGLDSLLGVNLVFTISTLGIKRFLSPGTGTSQTGWSSNGVSLSSLKRLPLMVLGLELVRLTHLHVVWGNEKEALLYGFLWRCVVNPRWLARSLTHSLAHSLIHLVYHSFAPTQ